MANQTLTDLTTEVNLTIGSMDNATAFINANGAGTEPGGASAAEVAALIPFTQGLATTRASLDAAVANALPVPPGPVTPAPAGSFIANTFARRK